MTIKGLTISQPWASRIADGEKFVENRSWFTGYRGFLAIHAGRGQQYLSREELKAYPTGVIVAVARLSACVTLDVIRSNAKSAMSSKDYLPGTKRTWGEVSKHLWTEGPHCLILEAVYKLPEPVPMVGAMGLWPVPENVVEILRKQHHAHLEASR